MKQDEQKSQGTQQNQERKDVIISTHEMKENTKKSSTKLIKKLFFLETLYRTIFFCFLLERIK